MWFIAHFAVVVRNEEKKSYPISAYKKYVTLHSLLALSVRPSICLSVCLSVSLSVRPSVRPSARLPVNQS